MGRFFGDGNTRSSDLGLLVAWRSPDQIRKPSLALTAALLQSILKLCPSFLNTLMPKRLKKSSEEGLSLTFFIATDMLIAITYKGLKTVRN
jgi:hypothetical protein